MEKIIPQWIYGVSRMLRGAVIVMSVLLIVYVSYDILNGIALVDAERYLSFQLVVCIVFIASLCVDWCIAPRKWRFLWHNLFFFL